MEIEMFFGTLSFLLTLFPPVSRYPILAILSRLSLLATYLPCYRAECVLYTKEKGTVLWLFKMMS